MDLYRPRSGDRVNGNNSGTMATNARYSLPPSSNGHVKGSGAAGHAPLPHIDDVVALPRDIDTNQSMKRLLESAETSLRQAEMSRDFNRPALAMKDYIRASVIAVQVIANHKDYPSLKGGRTDLGQVHSALLKKITNQNDIYEKIKQDIIADNRKSGVLPASKRQTNGGHVRQASVPNGSAHSSSTFGQPVSTNSAGKVKPTVQPKPHSLQGNAVSGHGRSSSTTTVNVDLAARFANLRGPQASPGQDPRIKTHPIPPLKPAGPREMPSPHKSKPSIDLGMPTLPKMPDATYNPTRGGSVSGDTGRPPQSTPRSLYSRNESSTSLSSIQSTGPSSQQNEYFPPMPANNSGTKKTSAASSLIVSQNDSITPEELFEAMKQKGSVLIIDIRSREDFDEGHIMSSSTICIEPSVLLRENLSADEISESLVLSPNQEQDLFEQRNKYNLVVFYDQDSEEIPRSPRNSDDLVVVSMHRALVHFNYGYELRQAPKILKGGLDAWIDLMGSAALQSVSAKPGSAQQVTPARRRNGTFQRRRSKYLVRPLRPDEVKAWQETLENEEMNAATVPSFHRSTESFLRRYPPVISEQESMTSPSVSEQPPRYGSSHKGDLYTDLPSPPSRPAPAVPRLSYSSLSHTNDDTELYHEPATPTAPRPAVRNSKVSEQSTGDGIKYYTGLNNPHNWCYANSTLQSLLASPDFGKELADSMWTSRYKAPRKENEKIDHPQLMIRIVSNLFHWMSTGKFEVMKAQTLMVCYRRLLFHQLQLNR